MEEKAAVDLINLAASSGSVGAMILAVVAWLRVRFDRVDAEISGHKKATEERFDRVDKRLDRTEQRDDVAEARDREHSRRLARIEAERAACRELELAGADPAQSMRGRVVST